MLHYRQGDPFEPPDAGPRIMAHVGSDAGRWRSPAVARRWPEVRRAWRRWLEEPEFGLGETQFVQVQPDVVVATMVARREEDPGRSPLRYPALRKCLRAVREEALKRGATLHLPRMGDWSRVEAILEAELPDIDVFVYDRPEQSEEREAGA